MVKVVIVGCGFMGETHAAGYAESKNAEIVGFVDVAAKARKRLAGRFGGRDYVNLEEALAAEEADAVDICLPTDLNYEHARSAARAGKHVMLEKPIALDLATADAIIRHVRRKKLVFMVGHVLRFWPEYVAIKKLVDSGKLGKVVTAEAVRLCQSPVWSPWFLEPKRGGGGILNLGIHDIDFLNWLFGRPRTVFAAGEKVRGGVYHDLETLLVYPKGVAASAKTCMTMPKGYPFTMMLRVRGTKGTVELIFRAGGNLETRGGAQSELMFYPEKGRPVRPKVKAGDGYKEEVAYFVECVKGGRQPEIATGADARLALKVALTAVESAKTGRALRA